MKEQSPVKILAEKLLQMYTENNLNKITSKLISLYKSKQNEALIKIADSLSGHVSISADKKNFRIGKYFTKLVILYHPDKLTSYRKIINNAVNESNLEGLTGLNHIFITTNILNDYKSTSVESGGKSAYYYDHDFEPDPVLYPDMNNMIFDLEILEEDPSSENRTQIVKEDLDNLIDEFNNSEYCSFFELYSKIGLSDKLKVEMSSVGMKNLNGIEDFSELIFLDLSGNKLKDITVLWYSSKLEELYLAYNQIYSVTSLCNLRHLRILDLADNKIDDISDLYDLPSLEFVNLINNPVHEDQIDRLRSKVEIVLF